MAGTPTKAEVQTMHKNSVDILEKSRVFGASLVGGGSEFDVLEQSVEGEFAPGALINAGKRSRGSLAGACSVGAARSYLSPIVREYARLANHPGWNSSPINDLLGVAYRYWIDQDEKVTARGFTYGAASMSGSNTGNGTIVRCTIDAFGNNRENAWSETKTAECTTDQNSGARRHEEVWTVKGTNRGNDGLDVQGSGGIWAVPTRHAGTSSANGSLLSNSSFQSYSSSATNVFTNWTKVSGTNPTQDTTNFYRDFAGDPDAGAHSMILGATVLLSQKISVRRLRMSRGIPYYLSVMYNRAIGSGDLTLKLKLGSQTVTVVIAAQTGWNELKLPLDANSYLQNFNEDELDVALEVSSYTSGTVLVDDMILCPMTDVGGTFMAVRGGTTPFQAANSSLPFGDTFTIADSGGAPATGTLQWWWWWAFGRYLPITGTTLVTDP